MENDEKAENEMFYRYYVEKSTGFIYQVQFFDTFAMHRPATPGFQDVVKKVGLTDFLNEFDEYEGDASDLESFLSGNGPRGERPLIAY